MVCMRVWCVCVSVCGVSTVYVCACVCVVCAQSVCVHGVSVCAWCVSLYACMCMALPLVYFLSVPQPLSLLPRGDFGPRQGIVCLSLLPYSSIPPSHWQICRVLPLLRLLDVKLTTIPFRLNKSFTYTGAHTCTHTHTILADLLSKADQALSTRVSQYRTYTDLAKPISGSGRQVLYKDTCDPRHPSFLDFS